MTFLEVYRAERVPHMNRVLSIVEMDSLFWLTQQNELSAGEKRER